MPTVIAGRSLSQAERNSVATTVHTALNKRGVIERAALEGRMVRWRSVSEA